jgi:hypothetical protein
MKKASAFGVAGDSSSSAKNETYRGEKRKLSTAFNVFLMAFTSSM